jgi:2-keto-3-deoxy-L-rhamnonate aldolase RhmA
MHRLDKALLQSGNTPLLGAAMYFYDPVFLEIVAQLGFNVVWIEMEHAAITFAEATDLCRMAAGSGMLTMIRIPDTRRESVLKAAECGPDIIDVPMANSPDQLRELVKYAKFAPEGSRGSFSVSRAVNYGIAESVSEAQQHLNRDLCLMAQVETMEAVERIEELCAIPGVDIFIGPADLAASLGVPGQTSHPKVMEAARHTIEVAKRHNRRIATACGPDEFANWLRVGVDLLFCTNDVVCLKTGALSALRQARDSIAQLGAEGFLTVQKREVG